MPDQQPGKAVAFPVANFQQCACAAFARVAKADFEQKRREFHGALQSRFFEQRRILGTEVYIVRRGDSLWSIAQRYAGVPVWLLQQYNPDLDLAELRAGSQLVVPKLESSAAGA